MKSYKYLGIITTLYITFQLVSDVTAGKLINVFGFPVSITVIYFPITYVFADVLTEVYGYARARRVVWQVLLASCLAGLIYQLAAVLPPANGFDANDAYVRVLGSVPRILLGGWIAVWVGGILNDYVMAKMKIWTNGKHLWTRTVGSTIIGEFANTVLFYSIALSGILPMNILVQAILTGWVIKCVVEVVLTPWTYFVCGKLKKLENEDYYDRKTDFNPFSLKV
ncbi:MAG TPA: queuosine precursor transporter [Verrucomicrobiae bacterium]|nr:queuosine precursor transporter [Verrucomicrobiae bacterium]